MKLDISRYWGLMPRQLDRRPHGFGRGVTGAADEAVGFPVGQQQ